MKWALRNQSQCSRTHAANIYITTCFFKQVCFPPSLPPTSPKIQNFYQQQNKINKQAIPELCLENWISVLKAPQACIFLPRTIYLGGIVSFLGYLVRRNFPITYNKKIFLVVQNPWVLGYSGLPNIILSPYSASAPEGLIIWPFHRLFFRFISMKAQA